MNHILFIRPYVSFILHSCRIKLTMNFSHVFLDQKLAREQKEELEQQQEIDPKEELKANDRVKELEQQQERDQEEALKVNNRTKELEQQQELDQKELLRLNNRVKELEQQQERDQEEALKVNNRTKELEQQLGLDQKEVLRLNNRVKELEQQQERDQEEVEKEQLLSKKKVCKVWKHSHFRNWANKTEIDATMFDDIEFLGNGCNGLVMKCSVPWNFENNVEHFTLALKMITNLGPSPTIEFSNLTKNEYIILSDSALGLHPNIVTMLGKFESKPTDNMINHVDASIRDLCYRNDGITIKGAQFFMVQCYEKTLEKVIKEEKPSKEKIIKYGVQIARALLHLYESKIAHLDMKLDNIMINDLDEIVVVDFGCASKLIDFKTNPGHTPGNRDHLAPEILEKTISVDRLPCKDQFSWELGVLLFEMISGGDLPWDTDPASILHPNEARLNERLSQIPEEFQFLKNLICIQENRMDLIDAWKTLELLYSP